jgi:hypothetical protein
VYFDGYAIMQSDTASLLPYNFTPGFTVEHWILPTPGCGSAIAQWFWDNGQQILSAGQTGKSAIHVPLLKTTTADFASSFYLYSTMNQNVFAYAPLLDSNWHHYAGIYPCPLK